MILLPVVHDSATFQGTIVATWLNLTGLMTLVPILFSIHSTATAHQNSVINLMTPP